jgi:hypothetical protein
MKEEKRKKIENIIGTSAIIIFVLFFIGAIIYTIFETDRETKCLKSYAIKFCYDNNMTYSSHNIKIIYCENPYYSPREVLSSETLPYYFTKEELKNCGA